MLGTKPCPLQEQEVFLILEPSLQRLVFEFHVSGELGLLLSSPPPHLPLSTAFLYLRSFSEDDDAFTDDSGYF